MTVKKQTKLNLLEFIYRVIQSKSSVIVIRNDKKSNKTMNGVTTWGDKYNVG